jgi:uncharacterized DUF497 family protein
VQIRVVWSHIDEIENISTYDIHFREAKEVVLNPSSLMIRNVKRDFTYIGPTDNLAKILLVYCILDDGFRRIVYARNASSVEQNSYFNFLAGDHL